MPPNRKQKLAAKKAEQKAKKDEEVLTTPEKKGSKSVKLESASTNTPVKGSPTKPGRGIGKK